MRRLAGCFLTVAIGCSSAPDSKVVSSGGDTSQSEGGAESSGGEAAGGQGGSAAGSGGTSEAGTTAVATDFAGPLGRRCDEATPCETGLECYLASGTSLGAYGPAGGVCSLHCTGDADCASLAEADSVEPPRCVALIPSVADSTICMPGCRLGDDAACGGRDEVACWALSDSPTDGTGRVCLPLCNSDEQCPAGTVCDGLTNLCSTWATAGGLSLGAECDAAAANTCENGFCMDLGGAGVCTSYCRRGSFPQCGGDGADAICGWVFVGDEAAGLADAGMCAETCACNADCTSGSYCGLHPDRAGMAKLGICTIGSATGIESCG